MQVHLAFVLYSEGRACTAGIELSRFVAALRLWAGPPALLAPPLLAASVEAGLEAGRASGLEASRKPGFVVGAVGSESMLLLCEFVVELARFELDEEAPLLISGKPSLGRVGFGAVAPPPLC